MFFSQKTRLQTQSKCAAVYLSVPQGGGFMLGPLDKPAKGQRMPNKPREKAADVSCFGSRADARILWIKYNKGKAPGASSRNPRRGYVSACT